MMIHKIPTNTGKGYCHSSLRLGIALTGLLWLSACVTTPTPPTESLLAAEMAISNAEQAGVADYASPELTAAREKLAQANSAVQQEEMEQARRFAEQARVDAELASAKTELAKAREVNNDILKSMNTLKQEMQRNNGEQP